MSDVQTGALGPASTALAIPELPTTEVDRSLANLALRPLAEAKQVLSCSALLQGETRVRAEAEAAKLLDEMLENTQVMMVYGTSELEGVNSLIDRLLGETDSIKVPEILELIKGLNREMRGIKSKYDVSDPDVRKRYEKHKGGLLRFFGRARSYVQLLMEDVRSIESQLGKVERTLTGRQLDLMRSVTYYDEMYDQNEQEILKLVYAIAVMELIRDLAAQRVQSIEVGDASLGDRRGEQKAALAEFVTNMEVKIAEYKGRLFVAWATSPQLRMMRSLNVGSSMRLNELVHVTLPTMKATMVQWRLLVQSSDAAKMAETVAAIHNQTLQDYARTSAEVVPTIAQAIQTPTLWPETIYKMADSISKQADGIVEAMEMGVQRRAEMDQAMLETRGVLANANQRISDAVVGQALTRAKQSLQIATSVPAVSAG